MNTLLLFVTTNVSYKYSALFIKTQHPCQRPKAGLLRHRYRSHHDQVSSSRLQNRRNSLESCIMNMFPKGRPGQASNYLPSVNHSMFNIIGWWGYMLPDWCIQPMQWKFLDTLHSSFVLVDLEGRFHPASHHRQREVAPSLNCLSK